jgi:hypothetical protein
MVMVGVMMAMGGCSRSSHSQHEKEEHKSDAGHPDNHADYLRISTEERIRGCVIDRSRMKWY